MSKQVVFKSYVNGPRWAKFPMYLRNTCHMLDLKLDYEVEKGLFRETVRFSVEGDKSKVKEFKIDLKLGLEEYNAK